MRIESFLYGGVKSSGASRAAYVRGWDGAPALVAVHQDATGRAKATALAYVAGTTGQFKLFSTR